MISSRLRQRLQSLSTEYFTRLQVIETQAYPLLEYSQGGEHITFTPHGMSHISAVEQNYDWLIPEADLENFNATELFCLLCATLFHDALMIPTSKGDEPAARAEHATRAHTFLVKNREALGLNIHEADAISQVIKAHAVYKLSEIPERVVLGTKSIDLRKLGACLSISDICHADSSRAPEIVFKHLELDGDSRRHWRRHLQISGITREDDSIIMSALTFSDDGLKAIEDYKEAIEHQLEIVAPYFKSILRPLTRVQLIERRLESPLDQTLQFQTNTPAILKLLIEGVYDREDVFIRELVQNSLDSCLIRQAKQQRRNVVYLPQILLTIFTQDNQLTALRVDDNGIGMDLNDVQDTVLWIGSSISTREDVVALLQQTFKKNLIATFGIGMLSCFKASNSISIRTRKENETPIQFELKSVANNIKPEKSNDQSIGTTIIVSLQDHCIEGMDIEDSAEYYFRMVQQASLRVMKLEWSDGLVNAPRDELFKIAETEAVLLNHWQYGNRKAHPVELEIQGDDFSGSICLPTPDIARIVGHKGSIDVLNEGVFVVQEPTTEWLPKHLDMCDGYLNFSSKAISLPAGRDRVIRDERYRAKSLELVGKSFKIVDELVANTGKMDSDRNSAALMLAYLYSKADPRSREKILKRLDDFCVCRFKRNDRIKLRDLAKEGRPVYLQYGKGRYVSDLSIMDGKQLYHKEDDFVELQAALMAQSQQSVLATALSNTETAKGEPILEASLIKDYLQSHGVRSIDLVEENVIEGTYRSRPVPNSVRQSVGSFVKFVEINGLPNKKAWKVGNELWVNVSNATMRDVYEQLQSGSLCEDKISLAGALFDLLSYDFDHALTRLTRSIKANQK